MKTLSLIAALLFATIANAQFSVDAGFITRGPSFTAGINYQKNLQANRDAGVGYYAMAGVSAAADNKKPTTGFLIGIGTNKYDKDPGWLKGNIILSAGAYWHTGVWCEDANGKETLVRQNLILPGAALQYQHWYCMPLKIAWDGKTTHITIGYIF